MTTSSSDPKNLMSEMIEQAAKRQADLIEAFAVTYLRHTGLTPDRVELVQETRGSQVVWYFRERAAAPKPPVRKKRGPETEEEKAAAAKMSLEEYDRLYDNGCSICRDPNCTNPGGQH